MKNIVRVIVWLCIISPAAAQDDDCNPNMSAGSGWFESKRSTYGLNCIQYALNRAVSTEFNGGVNVSLGGGAYKSLPWMDEYKKVSCSAPGGCFSTTIRQSYRGMQTYHNQQDVPVYSRPMFLENLGATIVLTSYSTEIDTTWLTYDDAEIREYVAEQSDMPDAIETTIEKYKEGGKTYYKAVGTIAIGKEPLTPSNLGEAIAKFGNAWMYHLIDKVNNVEIEHVHALKKKKNPYYRKEELERLYNVTTLSAQGSGKQGNWSWGMGGGKKSCFLENDGNEIRLFIKIKTDERKTVPVFEKMKEWVKKNPFDEAKTTEAVKSGNAYWVKATIDPSKFSGEDLLEDVFGEFYGDYGTEVTDEVNDIADDL